MMKSISTDIQHEVLLALLQDATTQDCAIEVIDNNGVVTLAGVVPSQEASDRAEAVALTIEGVGNVLNQLVVASHSAR
jgi:osmotically-inducible protein OsmY